MKIGLAKVDITPRVGVELQGYGPFLNRHSDGVRDRLYARAMAVAAGDERAVLVSCDLIGVSAAMVAQVRELVNSTNGIAAERVMVHAIHTHSGPAIRVYSGWGTPDPPYLEILPYRIAQACADALANLREARLEHAEAACAGVAINREYDAFQAATAAAALTEEWRPAKPETVDSTCHVLKVLDEDGHMTGFLSYYGCHPVIGGSGSRKIHGDYAGVATNLIERLHPGTVGLFLQGAQGDINSCLVCADEQAALSALDVVAARYARAVLAGLQQTRPVTVDTLKSARLFRQFARQPWDRAKLTALAAEPTARLHQSEASDADQETRMAMVRLMALRQLLARIDAGDEMSPRIELHGLRLGPIRLLGAPFEIFRAIKEEVVARAAPGIPLVMGFANDSLGYAPDRVAAARGGYAADIVPMICGQLPFANIHDELAAALLDLDRTLA